MARRSSSLFAVLGLLGVRDWTPYELVQHMKRSNIHFVWPRAESKIYEEPKRLARAGLAKATVDREHPRRTSYGITAAGRRLLAEWLASPAEPAVFESEGALKVLFAEQGTKDELLTTIDAIRTAELMELRKALDVLNAVLEEGPPFPHRTHVTSTVGELASRIRLTMIEWADWAEARVHGWPDVTIADENMRAEAEQTWRTMASSLERVLAKHPSDDESGAQSEGA